jgi:hypothetical protein
MAIAAVKAMQHTALIVGTMIKRVMGLRRFGTVLMFSFSLSET